MVQSTLVREILGNDIDAKWMYALENGRVVEFKRTIVADYVHNGIRYINSASLNDSKFDVSALKHIRRLIENSVGVIIVSSVGEIASHLQAKYNLEYNGKFYYTKEIEWVE